MIQKTYSKSNHEILMFNGQKLSSEYDPEKEANKWSRVQNLQESIKEYEVIILLGLGSGYQLHELGEMCRDKTLICVDHNPELVNFFLENNQNDIFSCKIFSFNELLMKERRFFQKKYKIIEFHPYTIKYPIEYVKIKEFLLARNSSGLNWIAKQRGLSLNITSDNLLSVKDLDSVELENSNFLKTTNILRELIK